MSSLIFFPCIKLFARPFIGPSSVSRSFLRGGGGRGAAFCCGYQFYSFFRPLAHFQKLRSITYLPLLPRDPLSSSLADVFAPVMISTWIDVLFRFLSFPPPPWLGVTYSFSFPRFLSLQDTLMGAVHCRPYIRIPIPLSLFLVLSLGHWVVYNQGPSSPVMSRMFWDSM